MRIIHSLLVLAALTNVASAQFNLSDEPAGALGILVGVSGSLQYDLGFCVDTGSSATTGSAGQSASQCSLGGGSAILADGFFLVTGNPGDFVEVRACKGVGTHVDPKLALWDFPWDLSPGTLVDCDDDSGCFPAGAAVTGQIGFSGSLLVQLGSSPATTPSAGTGGLNITITPECEFLDSLEPNDTCATARPLTLNGTTVGRVPLSIIDFDYYSFSLPPRTRLTVVSTATSFLPLFVARIVDLALLNGAPCESPGSAAVVSVVSADSQDIVIDNPYQDGASGGRPFSLRIGGIASSSCTTYFLDATLSPLPCEEFFDPFEPFNDDCQPQALSQNGCTWSGLSSSPVEQVVSLGDEDLWLGEIPPLSRVRIEVTRLNAGGDLKVLLWDAADAPVCGSSINGQSFFGGNGALICNTFASNPTTLTYCNTRNEPLPAILEVVLDENDQDATCATYQVEFFVDDCPTLSSPFCGPAVPNSTGSPSTVRIIGGSRIGQINTLIAEGLPVGSLGYFIVGQGTDVSSPVGSVGNICLGGAPIGRYSNFIQAADSSGRFVIELDNVNLPVGGGTAAMPFEIWHFQAWHRDFGGQNNFSEAVAMVWLN